ncbi:MAG: transporter substrate-binding domain-containing protein [Chlamydiae bacterium]|nr:transporter substrate-binding domain-containing protein [Chlamydiota bacterium]
MIRFIRCIFAAILFSASVGYADADSIVIGTSSGYAPYVSINTEGVYEGFDIDVSNELSAKLGKKCVVKDLGSMPSLLLALKQGKVDVVIWAVSITHERLEQMEMIHYQGEKIVSFPMVFWKQVPKGVKTFSDLSQDKFPGKTVCVEAGTCQEDTLKEYPEIKLKYVDKISDALMEIKYGKSLATSIDPSLLPSLMAKHKELKVVYFDLPSNLHFLGNGICVDKKNQQLANQIRIAVEELKASGKIVQLEKKWNLSG